jgi:transposase
MHALKHPAYLRALPAHQAAPGQAAGAKVARIDIARRLAHAIWHMPSRNQEFARRGAAFRLAA